MRKLNKILLIDDDEMDNYVNEQLLESLEIAENINVVTNGKDGLIYLYTQCDSETGVCPELIIFDHYIPVIDGMEMIKKLNAINFIDLHNM